MMFAGCFRTGITDRVKIKWTINAKVVSILVKKRGKIK